MLINLKSPILDNTHIVVKKILSDTKVVGDLGIMATIDGKQEFQSQYGNAVVKIADINSTLADIQAALNLQA